MSWSGLARPLASRGSRLPPAYGPLLVESLCWVDSCERLVQPELSPFRRTFPSGEPTKLYSRRALRSTAGITDMVIRYLDVNTSEVEGQLVIMMGSQ